MLFMTTSSDPSASLPLSLSLLASMVTAQTATTATAIAMMITAILFMLSVEKFAKAEY